MVISWCFISTGRSRSWAAGDRQDLAHGWRLPRPDCRKPGTGKYYRIIMSVAVMCLNIAEDPTDASRVTWRLQKDRSGVDTTLGESFQPVERIELTTDAVVPGITTHMQPVEGRVEDRIRMAILSADKKASWAADSGGDSAFPAGRRCR
jgi:hypothetical protein